MTKKYNLLDIPVKQAFANSGITQRVPYQLNPNDDDLNWLEGFTDSYQRPVVADDMQQGNGRYIKMGQLNQILQNLSQSFLNVKQGLDNVSKNIDDGILKRTQLILSEAESAIKERKNYLKLTTNQKAAGLKNFTGININNFKNTPQAVANLEWCNGLPLYKFYENNNFILNTNFVVDYKQALYEITASFGNSGGSSDLGIFLNSNYLQEIDTFTEYGRFCQNFSIITCNKDVLKFMLHPPEGKTYKTIFGI